MATERLSMRQIREILRQKLVLRCSHRQVAISLAISVGTVSSVLRRATHAGLDWAQIQTLSDDVLEARLYGAPTTSGATHPLPDCAYLHTERRKPGVTLELLHLEYLEQHPTGYRYTQFCELYRRWLTRHRLSMRQDHRAGEKVFVDDAGQRPTLVDPTTGAVTAVELFVGVLGASHDTFAEATPTQLLPDWLGSHGYGGKQNQRLIFLNQGKIPLRKHCQAELLNTYKSHPISFRQVLTLLRLLTTSSAF